MQDFIYDNQEIIKGQEAYDKKDGTVTVIIRFINTEKLEAVDLKNFTFSPNSVISVYDVPVSARVDVQEELLLKYIDQKEVVAKFMNVSINDQLISKMALHPYGSLPY